MNSYEHLTRQVDIIPVGCLNTPITIIGAGAIGSFTAIALTKMGFYNVAVFDDDKVDTVNMNCQFYRFRQIGNPKVYSLSNTVKEFSKVDIESNERRFTREDQTRKGVVIVTVDSMRARKDVWSVHRGKMADVDLYIDARMSAEEALVYSIRPGIEDEFYDKTLYSDTEAMAERCTAKSTVYTVLSIAGHIGAIMKSFVTSQPFPQTYIASYKHFDYTSLTKGLKNE